MATMKYNKYTGIATSVAIPASIIAKNKNSDPEKILCFIVKVANNAISDVSKTENLINFIRNSTISLISIPV